MDVNEHMKYLCEEACILKKQDLVGKTIAETFILHKNLAALLRQARERSEKMREIMIAKIKKKIPKLLTQTDMFNAEMQKGKYMDICSDTLKLLDDVEKNTMILDSLTKTSLDIQGFQRTLEFGAIT
jgi:hypothetical protein